MFTVEQIKAAHSKVKSGADFPRYIQELIALDVISYTSYVMDGHVDYMGKDDYQTSSPARYKSLHIADQCNSSQFIADLKAHQQGKTDYLTFCRIAAALGIDKWIVDMPAMTCTYFDKAGNNVLIEEIAH